MLRSLAALVREVLEILPRSSAERKGSLKSTLRLITSHHEAVFLFIQLQRQRSKHSCNPPVQNEEAVIILEALALLLQTDNSLHFQLSLRLPRPRDHRAFD